MWDYGPNGITSQVCLCISFRLLVAKPEHSKRREVNLIRLTWFHTRSIDLGDRGVGGEEGRANTHTHTGQLAHVLWPNCIIWLVLGLHLHKRLQGSSRGRWGGSRLNELPLVLAILCQYWLETRERERVGFGLKNLVTSYTLTALIKHLPSSYIESFFRSSDSGSQISRRLLVRILLIFAAMIRIGNFRFRPMLWF